MPTIAAEALREYIARIFAAVGAPPADARTVAEHLVESNLKGHDSHGVIRTPTYVARVRAGHVRPGVAPQLLAETAATASIDGAWNFGQVVARFAMDRAIAKARAAGVSVVTARRMGHVGRVGAYVEQAAEAGVAGIAFVNAPGGGQVAPAGGAGRRLSTNPIAVAAPTGDPAAPFVLDMATAVVAAGKVHVARNRGDRIPLDWIVDGTGMPTDDPRALDADQPGALMPLGGIAAHKGFGLSLVVEALAGALSGHGTSGPDEPGARRSNGLCFIALDIAHFQEPRAFAAKLDALREYVTSPPLAAGFERVLLPGDPERAAGAERAATGIPLDDTTWQQIVDCGVSLGAAPPAVR